MDGDASDEDVDEENNRRDKQKYGPEILAANRFGERAAERIDGGNQLVDGTPGQLALNDLARLAAGRLCAGERRDESLVCLALAKFGRIRNGNAGEQRRSIGLAGVDGQQIAAGFIGREFGDVASGGILAELNIDVAHL